MAISIHTLAELSGFRLWNDQGTNKIYVRHDLCGTNSEPVRDLSEVDQFRDQHTCPEGETYA